MTTLAWTEHAWEEYLFWQRTDKRRLKRINELIRESLRTPYEGKGKPEALRFDLAGFHSRRIDHEHRLVYKYDTEKDVLIIVQCRYHY